MASLGCNLQRSMMLPQLVSIMKRFTCNKPGEDHTTTAGTIGSSSWGGGALDGGPSDGGCPRCVGGALNLVGIRFRDTGPCREPGGGARMGALIGTGAHVPLARAATQRPGSEFTCSAGAHGSGPHRAVFRLLFCRGLARYPFVDPSRLDFGATLLRPPFCGE